MRLHLLLSDASQAEILRFYPKQDNSFWEASSDNIISDNPEDLLEVAVGFEQALQLWGDVPQLHVCKSYGILLLNSEPEHRIRQFLAEHELYIFAADRITAGRLAEEEFHSVEYLAEFYANPSSSKLLLCSDPEIVKLIISSAPRSYMHILLRDKKISLCLGAELWQYQAEAFRSAFYFAESLCMQLSNLDMIPFLTAQTCLKQGSGAYGFFANRYDSYMAHVDYELWYSKLMSWQKGYSSRACHRVLELACGTANVAIRFVQAGCEVDACDISTQMLELAYQKNLKPNLYQAALTDRIPKKGYDLILCLFDSINYLSSSAQISKCLQQVAHSLAEGGLFIFDISTMLNSMQNFSDSCDYTIEPTARMVHEAYYKVGKREQISRLSLFTQFGECYYLQEEEHLQKVYRCEELIELIKRSDLSLKAIHTTDSKTNFYPKKVSGIDHRHYRLFFILSKDESSVSE